MPDNKVDGIRKLDKEELKRSRKIVLDSIGEALNVANSPVAPAAADKTRKAGGSMAVLPSASGGINKVDGIRAKSDEREAADIAPAGGAAAVAADKKAEASAEEEVSPEEKEKIMKWRAQAKKLMSFSPPAPDHGPAAAKPPRNAEPEKEKKDTPPRPAGRYGPADGAAGPSARPSKSPEAVYPRRRPSGGDSGIMRFIMKNYTETGKSGEAEKARAGEGAARKKREAEAKRLESIRQEKEREREKARLVILREEARRRAKKEKLAGKLRRQKRIAAMKKNIFAFFAGLGKRITVSAKKASYMFAVIALAGIFAYALWLVFVLRADFDNRAVRVMAARVPTPAVITRYGIMDYKVYREFADKAAADVNGEARSEYLRSMIARYVILDNLVKKYGLPPITPGKENEKELTERLSRLIVYDDTVNQVPISRIRKIKQLIDKNGDFVRTANTYGDEQGQININAGNSASIAYADEISGLNIGEVSGIVYAPEGYYIFKCYEKKEDNSGLSYVFIRAKTLDQYINAAALKMKMWYLAD